MIAVSFALDAICRQVDAPKVIAKMKFCQET